MDELTLGVIPLGSEVSPGVNFCPLCLWDCSGLVVLVGGGGGLVMVPGWRGHSPMVSAAKNKQMLAGMSSCWCWWGKLFPRGVVHSHVSCVEWELPGWALQPRKQGSGLGQVPGLFLQREGNVNTLWWRYYLSLCLTCLNQMFLFLVARVGREWVVPPNLTGV